jgi:hypothetical protein
MLSPQLLELLRVWWREERRAACCCREAACFPAVTRSNRCRPASSVVPSTPPPKPRGSKNASRHTRCGTASPRICSNKMSIFV